MYYVLVNGCDALGCYNHVEECRTKEQALAFVKKTMEEMDFNKSNFRIIYGISVEVPDGNTTSSE